MDRLSRRKNGGKTGPAIVCWFRWSVRTLDAAHLRRARERGEDWPLVDDRAIGAVCVLEKGCGDANSANLDQKRCPGNRLPPCCSYCAGLDSHQPRALHRPPFPHRPTLARSAHKPPDAQLDASAVGSHGISARTACPTLLVHAQRVLPFSSAFARCWGVTYVFPELMLPSWLGARDRGAAGSPCPRTQVVIGLPSPVGKPMGANTLPWSDKWGPIHWRKVAAARLRLENGRFWRDATCRRP